MLIPTTNPINGRCCGTRQEASVYVCCGANPWGRPIEDYILDPAELWADGFQRGVKIVPREPNVTVIGKVKEKWALKDVNDLVIFVGKSFYPSPWDFVEETRGFGVSRKVIPTLPFDKLTPGKSNMVFVHSRAIPTFIYTCDREAPLSHCHQMGKGEWNDVGAGHHPDNSSCTFALRDLTHVIGSKMVKVWEDGKGFDVDLPAFTYRGKILDAYDYYDDSEFDWEVGAFLTLPLTHIEFCRRENTKVADKVRDAGYETIILPY